MNETNKMHHHTKTPANFVFCLHHFLRFATATIEYYTLHNENLSKNVSYNFLITPPVSLKSISKFENLISPALDETRIFALSLIRT